jgi:hypothetical protein
MMPRAMARKPRHPEKLKNACRTANLQHISFIGGAPRSRCVKRKAVRASNFRSQLAQPSIAVKGDATGPNQAETGRRAIKASNCQKWAIAPRWIRRARERRPAIS